MPSPLHSYLAPSCRVRASVYSARPAAGGQLPTSSDKKLHQIAIEVRRFTPQIINVTTRWHLLALCMVSTTNWT